MHLLTVQCMVIAMLEGALLGALGQASRAIASPKKVSEAAHAENQTFADQFQRSTLYVNSLSGLTAGALALLVVPDTPDAAGKLTTQTTLTIVAAGMPPPTLSKRFMNR